MLDNTLNQPSKFRKKCWIQVNDDMRGRYNNNKKIKFKISILKSSLCNYSDTHILIKGNIAITGPPSGKNDARLTATNQTSKRNKKVAFKNCAPFINCINEMNCTQIDNAKVIDLVMPVYDLIEYTDNYSKTWGL